MFDLEITARCNNNCRHCYINLPANDGEAKKRELSLEEIDTLAAEAASLGAFWCTITGGEPLLREDFFDIYLSLRQKGLLIALFTNANLITKRHVEFFKKHPPRDIEISVYGATRKTYENVTRKPGSFKSFIRGIDLLQANGIKVRFKAMALGSNFHEMEKIGAFCREKTVDYYHFDPFLNLRHDGDRKRNEEIKSERLSPAQIVAVEKNDPPRFHSLKKNCDKLILPGLADNICNHIFTCGVGMSYFVISPEGFFRPCSSLCHPDCVYDLRKGHLKEAWDQQVLKIKEIRSNRKEYQKKCMKCPIINLCMWCPALAHLETGHLDKWVEYFCEVAQARAGAIKNT